MNVIEVKQLGLAAYIKVSGAELVGVHEGVFTFLSLKSVSEWRIDYVNSCCQKHDSAVCELRRYLK